LRKEIGKESRLADLPTIFRQALEHHQSGRLADAISLYDSILSQAPAHAETLYLRGVAATQQSDWPTAELTLKRAIHEQPKRAPYWMSLAQVQKGIGQRNQAKQSLEHALSLDRQFAPAHFELADLLLVDKQTREARFHYQAGLAVDPNVLSAWINLAQAEIWLEEFASAHTSADRACQLDARSREAIFNRAVAARALGKFDLAEADYRNILSIDPLYKPAIVNLANLLRGEGRADEAGQLLQNAVHAHPQDATLLFAWGSFLQEEGDHTKAIDLYRQLLAKDPDHPAATENLATAYRRTGDWEVAVSLLRQATTQRPDDPAPWIQLGHAYLEREDDQLALEAMRQVVRCRPLDWTSTLRAARICPLLYNSAEEIAIYRAGFETTLRDLLTRRRPIADLDITLPGLEPSFHLPFHGLDDRPVKELYSQLFEEVGWDRFQPRSNTERPHLGIVVTDSHEPVFLRSMGGIINRLERREYRLSIVASSKGAARIRQELQNDEIDFVVIPERFEGAARMIADSSFDLLFYWEIGTDFLNYFLPMARLAPIQAVSWGVPITTGHRHVQDYLTSDLLEIPTADSHYTERLIRFQHLLSYQLRRPACSTRPDRDQFGLAPGDHVYVCAQNLGKFHPNFVQTLAEVVERDPDARLVVTSSRHPWPSRMLENLLTQALGIRADRIKILPPLSPAKYHELLQVSDVQLDPFPFSGANSSYDAFSFSLPVVTLEGTFQRSRFTSACYRAMNLEDWITTSSESYVERAVRWGQQRDLREEDRRVLGERAPILFEDAETVREWEEYVIERVSC
jgi:predicted O-linked N-acetylglucosamine transferase (SPINDLY family)